jgi:hypothetical protein
LGGKARFILGFLKERGRMKAIQSAKVAAFLINALARELWRPNGGFPKTTIFEVDGGAH